MGRYTMMIGTLALVVAACSAGASPSPAPTSTPTATAVAATPSPATPAPATPAPSASSMAITAAVAFDGQACTYAGPTVVPSGVVVMFSMVNTPAALKNSVGAALAVVPVPDGMTWDQLVAYGKTGKQSVVPPWYDATPGEIAVLFPEPAALGHTMAIPMIRNAYLVSCGTAPTETDRIYPAILLKVLPK
jgi:hypothetical protein